ncbi:hypothetical protein B0J17DRAFT_630536 [Rhizoctonia solani]|nr:hypothetical protein B0J17DRAFT_630536 [Rhizoctonia solani]
MANAGFTDPPTFTPGPTTSQSPDNKEPTLHDIMGILDIICTSLQGLDHCLIQLKQVVLEQTETSSKQSKMLESIQRETQGIKNLAQNIYTGGDNNSDSSMVW